jgi:hypothetical protein
VAKADMQAETMADQSHRCHQKADHVDLDQKKVISQKDTTDRVDTLVEITETNNKRENNNDST